MADYGLKIVKEGASVESAEVRDYIVWSKHPLMKTVLYGTYDYTFASDLSAVTITIPHNMGHKGATWFSVGFAGVNYSDNRQVYYDDGLGNATLATWKIKTRTNDIQIIYDEQLTEGTGVDTTGFTFHFKFYVFVESVE